jgi:hypothetical protein
MLLGLRASCFKGWGKKMLKILIAFLLISFTGLLATAQERVNKKTEIPPHVVCSSKGVADIGLGVVSAQPRNTPIAGDSLSISISTINSWGPSKKYFDGELKIVHGKGEICTFYLTDNDDITQAKTLIQFVNGSDDRILRLNGVATAKTKITAEGYDPETKKTKTFDFEFDYNTLSCRVSALVIEKGGCANATLPSRESSRRDRTTTNCFPSGIGSNR